MRINLNTTKGFKTRGFENGMQGDFPTTFRRLTGWPGVFLMGAFFSMLLAMSGSVGTAASLASATDPVSKAQAVFAEYQQDVANYDLSRLLKLYDTRAKMRLEVYSPGGSTVMTLNPRQVSEYLGANLKNYQDSNAVFTFPMVNYVPEGNGVRVHYYFMNSASTAVNAYMEADLKIAPNTKGQWKVVEDHSVVQDPDGSIAQALTLYLHQGKHKGNGKDVVQVPVAFLKKPDTAAPSSVPSLPRNPGSEAQGKSHGMKHHSSNAPFSNKTVAAGMQPLPEPPHTDVMPPKHPIIKLE